MPNDCASLAVAGQNYRTYPPPEQRPWRHLPYCHRVLLENLLRHLDGENVTPADIDALLDGESEGVREIAFYPARVLLQDFTGVPVLADLAAMRDAVAELGGAPLRVNPLRPTDLIIDHSVQVDAFANPGAYDRNAELELQRNRERYAFLRWGQGSFANLRVAPPDRGIVHQVNLEYLAQVVCTETVDGVPTAFPDTLVGADSHTPMVNGLGVLGWGVGGIEAEAAMLGEPLSLVIPPVTGVRLSGRLREGVTATDLVLTLTQKLRARGVVGRFVEFLGPGLAQLPLPDRATIANMSPEFGATCAYFPIDDETLRYLAQSGRTTGQIALVEAYARAQGLFRTAADEAGIRYSDLLELNLGQVEPTLAGPRKPQERVPLSQSGAAFRQALAQSHPDRVPVKTGDLHDGSVVIAAITSCTNTSNPAVMVAAGLLARKARARGLRVPPWVKTSLAPGSRVVMDYLAAAGLDDDLAALGFHLVAFGCTTCIGNSGPLPEAVSQAIRQRDLQVCAVLSGNRNFEGRIHPEVSHSYLASPPLVVAFALAGRIDLDLTAEPLAHDPQGRPVTLAELWPSNREVADTLAHCLQPAMFRAAYADLFSNAQAWRTLDVPAGDRYPWQADSTYLQPPPFLAGLSRQPPPSPLIQEARVLAWLGDAVTTDHLSPAGAIPADSPAGRYLATLGVPVAEFNAYGTRRGNHQVMLRGAFANPRLRNRLTPSLPGGWTVHLASGEAMTIPAAAARYQAEGTPLLVLAGREYGSGSSRDWAAKGPALLGVKAVLAVSFERIHRTNLVGMGILPLQFLEGEDAALLGLDGHEWFGIEPVGEGRPETLWVTARSPNGKEVGFVVRVRIDTAREWLWYRHGGLLPMVTRRLLEEPTP